MIDPILLSFLPLVGAFLVPLTGKYKPHFTASVLFLTLLSLVWASLPVLRGENVHRVYSWAKELDLNFEVYMDSLSAFFSILTCFLCLLAAVYSARYMEREEGLSRYYLAYLLFSGGMIGVLLSGNLLQFYLFWELMSLTCFLLVSQLGTGAAHRAAFKYFVMIHAGALCLLLAICTIYLKVGELSMPRLKTLLSPSPGWLGPVSLLTLLGFCFKAGVVPLHTWLPEAHPEAPTPVSSLLSGIMVKTGIYGVLRFLFDVFGLSLSSSTLGLATSTLGILAILVGVHAALVEKDIKKFLAFSTIANIGYIVLAVGVGSGLGLTAGIFHLLNHALLKSSLFMLAGCVLYRTGTRNIDEMGGLGKVMPVTAGLFLIGALAISGIPPFNAFASKLLVYQAALVPFSPIYACYAFLAIYASIVIFVAFMRVTHAVFFGSIQDRLRRVKEVPASMLAPPLILITISVLFGVLPNLPLSFVAPGVQSLGPGGAFDLTSSWLGYMTPIGFYRALTLSVLIAGSFGVAGALYLSSLKLVPRAPVPVKLETMIGGEEVTSLGRSRVGAEPFSGSFRNALKPLYNIAEKSGFDILWVGLARGVQKSASGIHRRLLTAGYVPVMLLLLAFSVMVLVFLVV